MIKREWSKMNSKQSAIIQIDVHLWSQFERYCKANKLDMDSTIEKILKSALRYRQSMGYDRRTPEERIIAYNKEYTPEG